LIGAAALALARRLNWLYLDMTNRRCGGNAGSPDHAQTKRLSEMAIRRKAISL
jgi:hypothetical protein